MPVACRIHPLGIYFLCECSILFSINYGKINDLCCCYINASLESIFNLICPHVSFSKHSRRLQCVRLICSYLVHTLPWWVMSTYGSRFSIKQTVILLIVRSYTAPQFLSSWQFVEAFNFKSWPLDIPTTTSHFELGQHLNIHSNTNKNHPYHVSHNYSS